jgi:hypothetical protein
MKRLFRGRPVLGWFALALALFAVLGHMCVLPHEAHAVAAEPSESHGSHHEHSQHDALHTASCEAVQSSVTPAASVLPAAGLVLVAAFAELAPGGIDVRRPPAITASPPLFLLHSSFLI